jgi:REP element-mobilizing transposase RayT
MTRPLRIQYPGAWYHVTCRGNERRDIFADDSDRCQFLDILTESCAIYGVEIHGYVLMTNHFHFVVHTPQANLNRFMQRFNTTYTVYFNRRHHRSGHLFQGRYKALLVDADSYLLELSRYVHLNPVRVKGNAALSPTEKRETLRSYRWSSFNGYIQLGKRPEFLHCGKILTMIGTGDDPHSRRAYRRFVQKGLDAAPEFNL